MRRHSKGAIELSANFIVVIVISIVVLVGGMTLFFKIKGNAQSYVDALDSQTEDNIKAMMLSNNYRVAAYPQDLTISSGDAKLVGLGITNTVDNGGSTTNFYITVSVKHYINSDIAGALITDSSYYSMTSDTLTVAPQDQAVKSILLKIPSTNAGPGQYVYTFNVEYDDPNGGRINFGKAQVYVESS